MIDKMLAAGLDRRNLLKLGASAGALAAPFVSRAAFAAAKPVKIGMITPETGPMAIFGGPSRWVAGLAQKSLAEGVAIAGEKRSVEIIARDSQSSANRAAEVAAQLINNDKVDILIASSGGDTVLPVADQAELAGVPCITTDCPWQEFFFGRKGDPRKGFEWTYHFFFGLDALVDLYAEMWKTLPTNGVVGVMLPNDQDGAAASHPEHGFAATIKKHGLDARALGLYPPQADDFSAQIAQLKAQKVEILTGVFNPPQFAILWTQCAQQGFFPKIATPAKAALFPAAVNALGDRGAGISTEIWWSPDHPFSSPLTGQSAKQFAEAYEAASGQQWTQPLGFKLANIEVAVDALKRAKKLDAESIRDAIAATDLATIVGKVAWAGGPGPTRPVPNVSTTPLVGGQWRKGEKHKYDLGVVFNQTAPEIPVTQKFVALSAG